MAKDFQNVDDIMKLLGDAGDVGSTSGPAPPSQDHTDIDDLMGAFDWDDDAGGGEKTGATVSAGAGASSTTKVQRKTTVPTALRFNSKDSKVARDKKVEKLKAAIKDAEAKKQPILEKQAKCEAGSMESIAVSKELEEISNVIEDHQAEIDLMEAPALDFGGLDDALDGLMENITEGNDTSEMSGIFSEKRCGKCNKMVAVTEEIKMFGRTFHVKCSTPCSKCGELIDPHDTSGQEEANEKIQEFKDKIAKVEKEKQGLAMMTALYPAGSKEAEGVQGQIKDCDNKLRRFERQMGQVEVKAVTFVEYGTMVWHSDCLTCAVEGCKKKLDSAQWVMPDDVGMAMIVCKHCCFKSQGMICTGCDKPIDRGVGEVPVTAKGLKYHKTCFVCAHCQKPLKAFRDHDGKVYCTPCHTKIF